MLATVTVLNTTTINWFNESTVLFNYVLITYSIFISDRNWFYFPSFVLQCTWYPFCLFINSVWKKRCSVKLNTYLKNKIYNTGNVLINFLLFIYILKDKNVFIFMQQMLKCWQQCIQKHGQIFKLIFFPIINGNFALFWLHLSNKLMYIMN